MATTTTTSVTEETVASPTSDTTITTTTDKSEDKTVTKTSEKTTSGGMTRTVNVTNTYYCTESHDNPFVKGSEIYQKADSILEHSIISRTQLSIYDPDQIQLEEMCKAETSPEAQSAPSDPNRSPNKNEINKTNGNVEDPLTAQKVEPTETGKANASQPEAKEPEEVKGGKDKNKKCKCCVVM